MKYKNLVVGEKVQVKHTHTEEYCQDYFEEGQVFEVLRVDADGVFKVEGEQFGLGIGYGRPENFRKYKEPQQEPEPEQETDVPFKEGTIVELKEDTVSKHGENVPFGLYVTRGVVVNEGWTILYTKHGGLGRAVVRTELLTAVGALTAPNEEQDDGQE